MALIIPDDMVETVIVAGTGVGAALIGGIVWLASLGGRISHLEVKMRELEETYIQEQRDLVAQMKGVRDDIVHVASGLASAREEALRHFADNGDLQRVEDKLDKLLERPIPARATQTRRRPN